MTCCSIERVRYDDGTEVELLNYNIKVSKAGVFKFRMLATNVRGDVGKSDIITVKINEKVTNNMNFDPRFKETPSCSFL